MVVIIPWRGGDPHRERAWGWVRAQYKKMDGVKVVRADFESSEPWCKAKAVMPALKSAPSEVIAIADADVWCDGLTSAARAVICGAAEWAVPHLDVYRLTQDATDQLIAGKKANEFERKHEGMLGGGIVVAHRDTFLDVPLDSRFKGWGQEDESFGTALATICGEPWRGVAPLIHLWHPPAPKLEDRRGSVEGWKLWKRYCRERGNIEAMKQLVKEGACP